eukprot:1760149-Pyramimonas_sp.AAC.1
MAAATGQDDNRAPPKAERGERTAVRSVTHTLVQQENFNLSQDKARKLARLLLDMFPGTGSSWNSQRGSLESKDASKDASEGQ